MASSADAPTPASLDLVSVALAAVRAVANNVVHLPHDDDQMRELLRTCGVIERRVEAKARTEAALAGLEEEAAKGTKRPRKEIIFTDVFDNVMSKTTFSTSKTTFSTSITSFSMSKTTFLDPCIKIRMY